MVLVHLLKVYQWSNNLWRF